MTPIVERSNFPPKINHGLIAISVNLKSEVFLRHYIEIILFYFIRKPFMSKGKKSSDSFEIHKLNALFLSKSR